MITVEHVDFISIPTQDVARAKRFYGETLGLDVRDSSEPGIIAAANSLAMFCSARIA